MSQESHRQWLYLTLSEVACFKQRHYTVFHLVFLNIYRSSVLAQKFSLLNISKILEKYIHAGRIWYTKLL